MDTERFKNERYQTKKSALSRGKLRARGGEIVDDLIFIISRSIFSGLAGKFLLFCCYFCFVVDK